MLPALFLAHGHPMNALENNAYTDSWQQLVTGIPRPRAILCISAHWETPYPCLTGDKLPATVHDFYGFPPALYRQHYPCPGDPALAQTMAASLPGCRVVEGRGLDHGCWCLLARLFPQADIPVIQLAIATGHDADWHWSLGTLLRDWRAKGVLVIGSGNIVHNLRRWFEAPADHAWAADFDARIAQAIAAGDRDTLVGYAQLPHAPEAVPTPEHYLPLLYAAASAWGEPIVQTAFPPGNLGNACMRSVRFGSLAAA